MKLLVIRQQQLHVGLQQEADLLLRSSLALLLLVLRLLAEDGVQVLGHRQAHHEVCGERRRLVWPVGPAGPGLWRSRRTDDRLPVGVSEAVQIVAVGGVHAVLHHAGQLPLSCPCEVSLQQKQLSLLTTLISLKIQGLKLNNLLCGQSSSGLMLIRCGGHHRIE